MKDALIERIARAGPMHFDSFMDVCLYDPVGGFFSTGRVRPGTEGDFVTSPEVSPAFGALVGGWAAQNAPSGSAVFVEIGAGSGALLREIAPIWLDNDRDAYAIEVSEASREAIAHELPGVTVAAAFGELPTGTDAVVVANEVLDNLPAALAKRSSGGWVEIAVDTDGDALVLIEVPARRDVVDWCEENFDAVDDGSVVSVQLAAGWFIEGLLTRFRRCVVCIIDYGAPSEELADRDIASVVRTYSGHRTGHDWLSAPGATDITMDVNTSAIERVVLRCGGVVSRSSQRTFLEQLGAAERIADAYKRERAHAADGNIMGQLVARSERVGIEALLDTDGLGGFEVIVIRSGT